MQRDVGQHRKFKPRRAFGLFVICAALVVLVAGIWLVGRQLTRAEPAPVPRISTPSSTQLEPSADPTPARRTIRQSRPTAIWLPRPGGTMAESPVRPLRGCREVIVPPRSGPQVGDVFTCLDYQQPGTDTSSFTVLAGHSSLTLTTALNGLLEQRDALVGREVWLQTRASGDRRLTYRIDRELEIPTGELPSAARVWGTPEHPTPNRLVLVTCLWNEDGSITENLVLVGRLTGVR